MNPVLQHWNTLPAGEAEAAILPCNGSPAWAAALAGGRPFADAGSLLLAASQVWAALPPEDWQDAFATHPRIGERHAAAASQKALAWSSAEQSGTGFGDPEPCGNDPLHAGNLAYEQRFGRTFLIRAAGRSRAEILLALQARLSNSPEEELLEAAEQQREITALRLGRWLNGE